MNKTIGIVLALVLAIVSAIVIAGAVNKKSTSDNELSADENVFSELTSETSTDESNPILSDGSEESYPDENISSESETEESTSETNSTPAVTSEIPLLTVTPSATSKTLAEKTEPSATTGKTASSDSLSLSLKQGNGWDDGAGKFAQVDAVIKNTSSQQLNSWTVEVTLPAGAAISQIWNASYTQSGTKFSFTPAEHNKTVSAGGTADFGFIVSKANGMNLSSATVKSGGFSAQNTPGANNNNNNGNNNNNNNGGNKHGERIVAANALPVPAPSTDDWLFAKGNKIVDKNGKEVWLTGINWFGYNTGTNTFDGLWACDLNASLQGIADKGFNLLRVPISTELILQWKNGKAPNANFNQATNAYLVGMDSLEIFDYVVGQCRANGIKIMIDIHCADTDAMGHMKPMWYSDKISEKDYLDALAWMAQRYSNDDTIIAFDLENEQHGNANESPRAVWNGTKSADNWKYIAEKAANAVLAKNPNVLVMVEGIEIYPKDVKKNSSFKSTNPDDYFVTWWGGNLRGVKDNPVNLGRYQNKLVYSPHDYGPTVYEQPWFKKSYTYQSLYKDCWKDNWMFIYENNTAPLLIGEWGGYMTEPNITWMTHLRTLIKKNRLNHTFWCFNSNSGDTGGLVKDDFTTWDTEKYNFVKEVLWQKNGKFVGLDHKIPLGKNGITLSQA